MSKKSETKERMRRQRTHCDWGVDWRNLEGDPSTTWKDKELFGVKVTKEIKAYIRSSGHNTYLCLECADIGEECSVATDLWEALNPGGDWGTGVGITLDPTVIYISVDMLSRYAKRFEDLYDAISGEGWGLKPWIEEMMNPKELERYNQLSMGLDELVEKMDKGMAPKPPPEECNTPEKLRTWLEGFPSNAVIKGLSIQIGTTDDAESEKELVD